MLGHTPWAIAIVLLTSAHERSQAQDSCTAADWNDRRASGEDCINDQEERITSLDPTNALWQFKCPVQDLPDTSVSTADTIYTLDGTGTGHDGSAEDHAAAVATARACAAVCLQQRNDLGHLAALAGPAPTAQCVGVLYTAGSSCQLLSATIEATTGSSSAGVVDYYEWIDAPATYDTGFGPGTCGCPTNPVADRCVVGCESSSSRCVSLTDPVGGGSSVMAMSPGACQSATSVGSARIDEASTYQLATQSECLDKCAQVVPGYSLLLERGHPTETISYVPAGMSTGCQNGLSIDQAAAWCQSFIGCNGFWWTFFGRTCLKASWSDSSTFGHPYDTGNFYSVQKPCYGVTMKVHPRMNETHFICEVWDKGERPLPSDDAIYYDSITENAQCWLPLNALQTCIVPASDDTAAHDGAVVNIGAITNGEVDPACAAGAIADTGPVHCLKCDESFHPTGASAVCNPRRGVERSLWFEAGDQTCTAVCVDSVELGAACKQKALQGECEKDEAYMLANCPASCYAWEREDASCTEPVDPNEMILACTPCSAYRAGRETECQVGSALAAHACAPYGGGGYYGAPVHRVWVPFQGWRDIPLGFADATPVSTDFGTEYPDDRCQSILIGPNFGPLGVPVPPTANGDLNDRFQVTCAWSERECDSTSAAECDDGDQRHLSLRIDYYMDCESTTGCRLSPDFAASGQYCNRGVGSTLDDVHHGYRWLLPLCLQTPECINLGAEVAATLDEADDEVFLADCCSVTDLDAIPAGPDGSPDMKVMCEDAKSSAMSVGRGWQRAVLASAAVQLLLAMKF